jgi:hypothetical protein
MRVMTAVIFLMVASILSLMWVRPPGDGPVGSNGQLEASASGPTTK